MIKNRQRQSKKKILGGDSSLVGTNSGGSIPQQNAMTGGSSKNMGLLQQMWTYIHDHIMYLNSSKFFAGVIMILLNVGSKLIPVEFSKSTSEYLKYSITKQVIIFAMAWMGTRDIYTSLIITAVFVVLSEHLFNEESSACIVPHKHRVLHKLVDTNNDGIVSPEELKAAEKVLAKAKAEKLKKEQQDAFMRFDYHTVSN
jgi:hypothetical protein